MKVLKFGGSSLADTEAITGVLNILRQAEPNSVAAVVVSAIGGATDLLIEIIQHATSSEQTEKDTKLATLKERHLNIAEDLLTGERLEDAKGYVEESFAKVDTLLQALSVIGEDTGKTYDQIISIGELLSSTFVALALQERNTKAYHLDARKIIATDSTFSQAIVDQKKTYEQALEKIKSEDGIAVVPGFVAADSQGQTTTLGRGGSDYTAALVAAAIDAEALEIWTDVSGMLTADPRKVKDTFVIEELLYEEALELCHFGAKVLYPPTIQPVREKNIPALIKNTFDPQAAGTKIAPKVEKEQRVITGITSLNDVSLITLHGSGLVGVAGMSQRLFGALATHEISVILITQASSEHSICFAIQGSQTQKAKKAIEQEFQLEFETGKIDPLDIEEEVSIVTVVGQRMRQVPGVAASVFRSLAASRVNVIAIAQGSGERSISVVIQSKDEVAALNSIHRKFFLDVRRIHLVLIGPGQVGRALLNQLHNEKETLLKNRRLELRLVGIANSRQFLFEADGIPLDTAPEALSQEGQPLNAPEDLLNAILSTKLSHTVMIDCTASDSLSGLYEKLLENQIPIVTSNKKVQTESFETFERLLSLSRNKEVPIRFETSVGAALPVISTLQELLATGDRVRRIEATLSGTLSYLFNEYIEGGNFADLVKQAQEQGYTEPDPREDLSGMDVARKLLILARTAGHPIELDSISIEPLLPGACMDADSLESFYELLPSQLTELDKTRTQAQQNGERLHYIASFSEDKASVALKKVGSDSPFHGLRGTDNMIAFFTDRYPQQPLVIRGAGAGPEVTASGVFSDLIRIVQRKGTY